MVDILESHVEVYMALDKWIEDIEEKKHKLKRGEEKSRLQGEADAFRIIRTFFRRTHVRSAQEWKEKFKDETQNHIRLY